MCFKETHTLRPFLYDFSIAAGRHLGWDKDAPFYWVNRGIKSPYPTSPFPSEKKDGDT
jgi:hypothetical protein